MRFTGFPSPATTGSLLPFLLCRLHQFPFCLQPMTLVIPVPPPARKPDVVRALLNLPAQGRIRNVTVAIIGIGIHFCLRVRLFTKWPQMANAVFLV